MSQTGVTKYLKLSLKGILSRFTIKSLRSLTHVHAHDLLKVEYPLRPFELKLLTLTLSLSLSLCVQKEEELEPWPFRAQKPATSQFDPIQQGTYFPT
jgi:hypothetical protein